MDVQQESSSSFEKRSIGDDLAKPHHRDVASHDVDVAAGLTAGKEVSFTPEEAARVRYVSLLRLSPLLSISILFTHLHPSCAPPYIHAQHAKIADVRPAGGRLTGI